MFKNFIKIAWRNLWRHKSFTLINISGLAIGMASAALILFWIQNELSYDQFHENKSRLYVAYNRAVFDGKLWCWNTTPKILGKTLKQDYPAVEETARTTQSNFLFTIGDKHLNLPGYFTDPGFLTMFSFPLIKGNPKTALTTVNSLVITEKTAIKLFGNEDPMGKVVRIDSVDNFTVTGVMKDLPNNTRFDFEYLMPWSYLKKTGGDDTYWGNNSVQTWVLAKPNITEEALNKQVINVTKSHSDQKDDEVFMHPASKWHLYSKFENGKIVGGKIGSVRLFGIIALFILLIACINFMNLSTARSERRAREVGIRKVVGAQKGSLIAQFLGESILLAFIAGIIAIVIVQVSLPSFNQLTQKQLYIPFNSIYFWLAGLSFVLFTGLVAGSYPAFFLSSFRPVSVLKGTFKAANALVTPRKLLVVTQFTFAIVLIICTVIIHNQMRYAQNRDLGYKKNNLVYTMMSGSIDKNYKMIRSELISSGAAVSVTKTSAPMTEGWSDSWGFDWKGKDQSQKIDFNVFNADGDFVKTMGLHIVAGRDIDIATYPTDSTAMILNEAAVKIIGFKNPVGQIIKNGNNKPCTVVGVVQDFILQSPYQPVKPMIIQGPKSWFNVIHYKLNPNNSTADNLKRAEGVFKKFNSEYPYEYHFVDEEYAKKFNDEQQVGTLASLFAGLTIFISCLGLFGLAAYMAQNRQKEISVRKVLGASVSNLTGLLSKEFLTLVIISFIIASPIAWYGMYTWLKSYPYHVSIEIWVFLLAGILTVIVALGTVSFQSIKAALTNPIKSLRNE
ncbi:ABC transporter permease [Mucilaginibacter flavus]|uniref:ABC transporter permease n=1 Tax=Mucilaginibacter flavus TaxID=931504 RepID=UPI0025B60793|nr:ABC transporter permease [Mucilaginibacter flavus]MDN3583346.1 ABC transporter permease [Mucilaginibacter flavus]